MNLAPTIILIPYPVPVAGSAFPRVIDKPFHKQQKTNPSWPPPNHQQIPTEATRRMLDNARTEIAEQRARKLLLDERCP
jgi:hypothetical protein